MTHAPSPSQSRFAALLETIRHDRRRYALYALRESTYADLDELATAVAALESNVDPAAISDRLRDLVTSELHHVHLPKLAELDLVSFDARSGAARYHEPPTLTDRLIGSCVTLETAGESTGGGVLDD